MVIFRDEETEVPSINAVCAVIPSVNWIEAGLELRSISKAFSSTEIY